MSLAPPPAPVTTPGERVIWSLYNKIHHSRTDNATFVVGGDVRVSVYDAHVEGAGEAMRLNVNNGRLFVNSNFSGVLDGKYVSSVELETS
jgi:hypothetical protein